MTDEKLSELDPIPLPLQDGDLIYIVRPGSPPGNKISFLDFLSQLPVGTVAWGSITGVLSNQTDLQNELDDLQNQIVDRVPKGWILSSGLTIESQTLAGRISSGQGDIEEITLGDGLAFDGSSLKATAVAPAWGDITGVISDQTDLNDELQDRVEKGLVTDSELTMQTAKVLGRATAGTGAIEEKDVSGSGDVVLQDSPELNTPTINSPTGIVKGDVGLGNVDDTSDADKPVSTAQQAALDLKANLASPTFTGTPNAPTASPGTNTTQLATTAFVAAAGALVSKSVVGFTSDGGGNALAAGKVAGFFTVPYAGTITGWDIVADAGTVTIKVWKIATGTAKPTAANSINTSGVALATGTAIRSSTVTDFTTTAVAVGDIFAFNIEAISGVTQLSFGLEISR